MVAALPCWTAVSPSIFLAVGRSSPLLMPLQRLTALRFPAFAFPLLQRLMARFTASLGMGVAKFTCNPRRSFPTLSGVETTSLFCVTLTFPRW
jgi:hypothetical protein